MADASAPPLLNHPRLARWLTPAALVAGNLLPLFGVLFLGWDVAAIVMLYWAENVVIGAVTILKMFIANPLGAIFTSLFFLIHYGGFCAVHGLLAGSFFGIPTEDAMGGDWPFFFVFVELLVGVVVAVLDYAPDAWLYAIAAIAASHLVSMAVHFIARGERLEATVRDLMTAPYKRVIVLHLAILAGGFLVLTLGAPIFLLVILIALKIGLDLRIHMKSHKLV